MDSVKIGTVESVSGRRCRVRLQGSNTVLAEQCEETLQFRMQEHRKLIDVNKIFDTVIF